MGLVISKGLTLRKGYIGTDDPDAEAYIAAVEAADLASDPTAEPLETATKVAIHSFVKGAKADGFWPAIKSSCILAGARTRLGALTPLVGTAPTSFNFVDGDYNRKTGLVGDGSTKYLDSNRAGNADPLNNNHYSVWVSVANSATAGTYILQRCPLGIGDTGVYANAATGTPFRSRISVYNTAAGGTKTTVGATGLVGGSRSNSASFISRVSGSNETIASTSTSVAAQSGTYAVFRHGTTEELYSNARIAFYSIGESLNLALLEARVTDLINAFAAAIP
jgi:hypothetical protein